MYILENGGRENRRGIVKEIKRKQLTGGVVKTKRVPAEQIIGISTERGGSVVFRPNLDP
jgi:hypothetical protein